ncbi:LysR family transcriptional regulator [Atlantibacter sp.]|uniref:LysR family transcriptional regulator n=1 Tax=Atlantibacter sp. TaxID=1903473 RepID=UPI00289C94C6|nr:LysR family transcriptional regulator [Atlantibacter sp.]
MHFLLTKKLKYFMKVMEKGCLTKASEELFITRSPLGKTINELETLLGEQLFFRKHGLFKPTDYALNIYEKAEPLYRKIIDLESQLSKDEKSGFINVVVDDTFPDNFSDIIECGLKKNCQGFFFDRKKITQEGIDNGEFGSNSLIITAKSFHNPDQITHISFESSSMLMITNAELKNDFSKLTSTPLLLRENISDRIVNPVTIMLNQETRFTPRIMPVNGTIADFLLMASNGIGFMMLPLKTCQALCISRENTILINDLKTKIHFYHSAKCKNHDTLKNIKEYVRSIM